MSFTLTSAVPVSAMSSALSKAAPLKPEILLAQDLSEYEAILEANQKARFQALRGPSPLNINDVARFTAEIDRASFKRRGRRCVGPRLTNFLQSVQQFSTIVDELVELSSSSIVGTIWGVLKMAIKVSRMTVGASC